MLTGHQLDPMMKIYPVSFLVLIPFFLIDLLFLGGECVPGYGGTPFRKCRDNNEPVGEFGEIESPCIQCLLYLFIFFTI